MSLRVRIECNRRTPRSFSPILRKSVFLCKRFSFEEESKVSRDDEWKRIQERQKKGPLAVYFAIP